MMTKVKESQANEMYLRGRDMACILRQLYLYRLWLVFLENQLSTSTGIWSAVICVGSGMTLPRQS
jgi:hypothetical protein